MGKGRDVAADRRIMADLSRLSEREAVDAQQAAAGLCMEATPAVWWAAYVACRSALAALGPESRDGLAPLAEQVDLHYDLLGIDRDAVPKLLG